MVQEVTLAVQSGHRDHPDVFMPPGKRAKDLTWTSCGIMQPFDIVGCHLILGNGEWASALKQTRSVCFVNNLLPAYLSHTNVKCKIPLVKNRARSSPDEAGICRLDRTIFPFSTFPGLFKQCFGSSAPCPGAVSLVCMCECVCFPQYIIFVHNFNWFFFVVALRVTLLKVADPEIH